MPPGKPIKKYTGTADGRTIGHVLNELIDEINAQTNVLAMISESVIGMMSAKQLIEFGTQLDIMGKRNEE